MQPVETIGIIWSYYIVGVKKRVLFFFFFAGKLTTFLVTMRSGRMLVTGTDVTCLTTLSTSLQSERRSVVVFSSQQFFPDDFVMVPN